MTATILELRCPVGPRRLLAKMLDAGGPKPRYVEGGTLIELVCADCRRTEKMHGRPVPLRVLHRFNVLGDLVSTQHVWTEEQGPDEHATDEELARAT